MQAPTETSIQATRTGTPPEILAPAGGRAQFFAALNAGADAVYLGLKEFNARARAGNFTAEELAELVPLARRYGMKVLVTVNVLIKELELPKLVEKLGILEALGVHAIIVQDLAVARIARSHFPGLRLHASTQMAIHNLAGVREAQRQGFKRVVLARELTAREISQIRQAIPEMEIEAFCHGSLCYSYSGLCFFSGAEDARSGNRGECAYTCRQPYKLLNEPGHGFLFSMRDLDSSRELGTLVDTGVDTLKIEGRKKDAQYVASVVKLYRRELDKLFGRRTLRPEAPETARGETPAEQEIRHDLALSFQRNPTTFFLKGRYHENVIDLDNPTHLGVRVGEIRQVKNGFIVVKTETPIERFDGLRIKPAERVYHARPQHGDEVQASTEAMRKTYENETIEFALREMRIHGKWQPTAPAGSLVEIQLPEDTAPPSPGDVLYQTRSADLKRRVTKLEGLPPDARLRAWRPIAIKVELREELEALCLVGQARFHEEVLASAEIRVEKEKARGPSKLTSDLRSLLGVFGEEGFEAESLAVEPATGDWFVPRSRLKDLKHQLGAQLAERYDRFVDERKQRALRSLAMPGAAPAGGEPAFSVKIDRLEYLPELKGLSLAEIVFEPKRAFLPSADPVEATEALLATGVPIRLALPTVIRAWDEPFLKKWWRHAATRGITRYEIGNLGGWQILRDWELPTLDVKGDFTLYDLSSQASEFWAERGLKAIALSVEDDRANLREHLARFPWASGLRPQAILFKDTPLFIAEACSLTALHDGCPTGKVCGYRTLEIEGPTGERFSVAHESCKSIVYGHDAYSISVYKQELVEMGVRDFRVDFLTRRYSGERLREVWQACTAGQSVSRTHPANYSRQLL